MRDFPIFPTQYGLVSLILREIPYRAVAYIRIQSCEEEHFGPLMQECVSFCRGAGAERVLATGHRMLQAYPEICQILKMRGQARVDREKLEALFPVTEATISHWREIYNQRMKNVDNAGTLEQRDEAELLKSYGAYFVHRNGMLLGIGWLDDTKLLALASVQNGAGERVLNTLLSLVEGEQVELDVVSTNRQAIALYERMGFVTTGIVSQWYEVKL